MANVFGIQEVLAVAELPQHLGSTGLSGTAALLYWRSSCAYNTTVFRIAARRFCREADLATGSLVDGFRGKHPCRRAISGDRVGGWIR